MVGNKRLNIIAITIGSYPDGEASTNRNISILKGLVELNHNVELFVVSPTNKKCIGERIKKGVIEGLSYEYTSHSVKWPKSALRKITIVTASIINALSKLSKIHKNRTIDALLILTTKPYIMHPFIVFAKCKKIKTFHQQNELPILEFLAKKRKIEKIKLNYYLWLVKKISGVYVISQYLKDYYSNYIKPSNICVVNMTVDVDRFKGDFESPYNFKYIAYCGTMHGNKDGLEYLIKAYSLIYREISLKLLLIGDNQDKRVSNIVNLVKERKLEDKVIFAGSITSKEIPGYLQNSEILVLSRPDNLQAKGGFPTKLGEYLMTGKPVVVTSVGEIPLFLKDEKSAYIVQPDNIDDFAHKILYVINNYQKALIVAQEGKKVALKNFNYYTETQKLSNFINEIITQ